jgi:hypothetical protein
MQNIELLSIKLQSWINPAVQMKPIYTLLKPNNITGELEQIQRKYPRYYLRLKFSTVDLACKWVNIFRAELAELSGQNDYITVMVQQKPYCLTFVNNVDRTTGEIRDTITFTLVDALQVIAEEPELAEVEAFPSY